MSDCGCVCTECGYEFACESQEEACPACGQKRTIFKDKNFTALCGGSIEEASCVIGKECSKTNCSMNNNKGR